MIRLTPLLLLAALLPACEVEEPWCASDADCADNEVCLADDPEGELMLCGIDADGDGLRPGPMDCDDSDPLVNVNAPERCNAIDDDCDGEIDELGDSGIWFLDADGDGYGDPDEGTPNCRPELGLAGVDGDCDDDDPEVNPVADEHCNGIDDDCDGYVDDRAVDAVDLHADQDGDGWGVEEVTRTCPGAGWVEAEAGPWDCDDRDAEVFPGSTAHDVGMDGRDVDCDGSDACTDLDCDGWPDLVFSASSTQGSTDLWVLLSAGDPDLTGFDPVRLPGTSGWDTNVADLDGDGFIDLMAHSGAGEPTRVLWGSPSGPSADRVTELPGRGFSGIRPCVGEVDGHPGLDILIPSGVDGRIDVFPLRDGDYSARDEFSFSNGYTAYGCAVADLDGDGFDDLLVQASASGAPPSRVFMGGPTGIDAGTYVEVPGTGPIGQPRFADLDQDGVLDIIFPHIGSSRSATIAWGLKSGGGWIPAATTDLTGRATVYVTVGDVDADGLPDLVLPERDAGGAGVIRIFKNDAARFMTSTPTTVSGGRISHALLEDLDEDGAPELLVAGLYDTAFSAIWWNDGTGSFVGKQDVGTGGRSVVVIDIDGDGDMDPVFGGVSSHIPGSNRFTAFYLTNNSGSLDVAARRSFAPAAGVVRVVGNRPHPWNGGHR